MFKSTALRQFLAKHMPTRMGLALYQWKCSINPGNTSFVLPDTNKPSIVFFPSIDFSYHKQRPQHLAEAFHALGWRVFYLTNNWTTDNVQGIVELQKDFYLCSNYKDIQHIQSPVLYISWPGNMFMISAFTSPRIWYDIIDVLQVFPFYSQYMERMHEQLLQSSHICTASSRELQHTVKDRGILCHYMENGVSPTDFADPPGETVIELEELKQKGKHIIGFYGALAHWIDYDLLSEIATELPECHIFLIGPTVDNSLEESGILHYGNITYHPAVPYEKLTIYSQYFDIGIIPFRLTELTKAVSPVKLFEYMAQGIPTVSINIPEVLQYSPPVLTAALPAEWIQTIKHLLETNRETLQKALVSESKRHTWLQRVKEILHYL